MSQPEQSQHIIKEEKGNDLHEPAERRKDGQLVNWEIYLGLAHLKHTTTTFIYWLHSCLWRHKDSAPQKTTLPYQCFCFQNRLHIFWDALIQKRFFRWRKQFNFRGDLTDISAKKKPLVPMSLSVHRCAEHSENVMCQTMCRTMCGVYTQEYSWYDVDVFVVA